METKPSSYLFTKLKSYICEMKTEIVICFQHKFAKVTVLYVHDSSFKINVILISYLFFSQYFTDATFSCILITTAQNPQESPNNQNPQVPEEHVIIVLASS